MTDCNGCGSCCDPVVSALTQADAVTLDLDDRTRRWLLHELTPMTHREVRAIEPWLLDSVNLTASPGGDVVLPFFYRCRWFDRATRRCTNYDDRPPGCSDYPWGSFGGVPNPAVALPPTCSFRADVGQPVEVRVR